MGVLLEFPTNRVQAPMRTTKRRGAEKGRVILFEGIRYSRNEDTPCQSTGKKPRKSKKLKKDGN